MQVKLKMDSKEHPTQTYNKDHRGMCITRARSWSGTNNLAQQPLFSAIPTNSYSPTCNIAQTRRWLQTDTTMLLKTESDGLDPPHPPM